MAELTLDDMAHSTMPRQMAPLAGLAPGTKVLTLRGEVAIDQIVPGDRLITRNGAQSVVAVDRFDAGTRAVRIAAGGMGKDRPACDMILAAAQPVMVRNLQAGAAPCVTAAARLVNHGPVRFEPFTGTRLVALRFAQAQVIYAGGLDLPCPAA